MKAGLNLISRGFVKQGYLSDRYGSLFAPHRKFLSVRCVPEAAVDH